MIALDYFNFVQKFVDRQIVERLRDDGHSVWYVVEMSPSISDGEVLQLANNWTAPLITSDKDFGELVFRQHLVSYGVILVSYLGPFIWFEHGIKGKYGFLYHYQS